MERKSSWAVGYATFAAVILIMIGVSQIIAGLAGIFHNEFYVQTKNYFLEFDATAWGWFHLGWGVLVLIGGIGLFQGSTWGRTLGVIAAVGSAIANFAFIPLYPLWSITVIAFDVAVIWALTAHGSDIAAE